MMASTLCKLVSGDNKIPLNTYVDFKRERDRGREKEIIGRKKRKVIDDNDI